MYRRHQTAYGDYWEVHVTCHERKRPTRNRPLVDSRHWVSRRHWITHESISSPASNGAQWCGSCRSPLDAVVVADADMPSADSDTPRLAHRARARDK